MDFLLFGSSVTMQRCWYDSGGLTWHGWGWAWRHLGMHGHIARLICVNVIFLVCHRYYKENRVVSKTFFASFCILQYIGLVETHVIYYSKLFLDVYCNMGLSIMSPSPNYILQMCHY